MRKAISVVTSLLLWALAPHATLADSALEFSVQVSATVRHAPAQITLNWPQDTLSTPQSYTLFRKSPAAAFWGQGTVLPGSSTSYVDVNVTPGVAYEYQIVKKTAQYTGYGYVCAGVNVPLVENRGKLLLVVENTYAQQLASELNRLQQDLAGDGWTVVPLSVNRNDTAVHVKSLIRQQYQIDPANVKAVFLFGHVPVPYSGDIVPDGHVPDHRGAWPCDAYYGDMDGTWTDQYVNSTSASDQRNRNVPGDGKFDQSTLPAPAKLMVGRVDLANMPGRLTWGGPATFPNELELLRNYLNKNHKFRQKQFDLPRRAVLGDFFGARGGEAFAASGWRNFAGLFGANQIMNISAKGAWIPTLSSTPSLAAYGCGAGSYTSVAGLGNTGVYQDGVTTEMVGNDIKTAFALIFGSWLGDWDSEDNILRGVLALPSYGLASAWSGRPHWFIHHMALGETIGFGARLTQNNGPNGLYQTQVNSCAGQIHIALMGDPTLRLHMVAPPRNVARQSVEGGEIVSWESSAESVSGYNVYAAPSAAGPFTRLNNNLVTGATFTASGVAGQSLMVRAVKLETSASGTYWNASQGAFAAPATSNVPPPEDPGFTPIASPAPPVATGDSALTVWIDDALPSGARPGFQGGDAWTWVSANPGPASGSVSHQSALVSGLHQHYFDSATAGLTINPGEVLFADVYLDPANVPSEIMLQWNDGSWEHRAYWGADLIGYGQNGTSTRRYLGPLPAAGRWVRLHVPASQVDLERKTVTGMAFTLFNGRAAWDTAGKSSTLIAPTPPPATGGTTTTNDIGPTSEQILWVEDSLPTGAIPGSAGGDTWNWVTTTPTPFSGNRSFQSAIAGGLHQMFFTSASRTLTVNTGDLLVAGVYLDPANPPSEIMLQWHDGTWEHRAYWGANLIGYGADGTSSRHYMGRLPAPGKWVQLVISAKAVGLEGRTVTGMAFSQYNGRVTWDAAGKIPAEITPPTTPPPSSGTPTTSTNLLSWFDDALPTGATSGSDGGDSWNWVSAGPAPVSGTKAAQSIAAPGLHQVFFSSASKTLDVTTGETLFAHVFLDPANPPSQVMLQWNDGSWEHRAFWGVNFINYGTYGTAGRQYMGALPALGQWVRLEVPASKVGLENRSLSGMAFSLYDGRATWDYAGKYSLVTTTNPPPATTNAPPPVVTNTPPPVVTNTPPPTTTNTPPGSGGSGTVANVLPGVSSVDYLTLELPKVGDHTLHVLTPSLLELKLINTKEPDPARVTQWDFVDASGNLLAPAPSTFNVTANGRQIPVATLGFKRRPLYAPFVKYDLRIENSLYLQLTGPVSDNEVIEVKDTSGTLWPATMHFQGKNEPLRYSPAIHVNQEGYMPNYPKKAMVGYYAGSFGEINVPASAGFKLIEATTGNTVFQGTLVSRKDEGYTYTPTPYQKVYEADFSAFKTPGEYRLVVPGMGGSLPFMIENGIAMAFTRAYALGLYHQRCGTNTCLPYTRHTHDVCHNNPASVPYPESAYPFTWATIANYAQKINTDNPPQTAPALTSAAAQLFPFERQGQIDVSGGHHDAGDYSKYTANSANLVHYLMFAVDAFPGVANLDNLGLPESGDGISDMLQEAKWEADYLAKLQDSDGGFYFLVYPKDREYENGVPPDKGDAQVVWPKTTSATAAAVAALAQCASSPAFKRAYPQTAAIYLEKARLGWQFIQNAVAKYGRSGAYQKITHYGDVFADRDELVWAACEMFLATGDQSIHATLRSWFDPADPSTWRWGWWHMAENFGHAVRSYAFAARSGRLSAATLDAAFLSKCEAEIISAGDAATKWSTMNAYGTSFPDATKRVKAAGWYFSTDQAFDIAVAYQLIAKAGYLSAILANLNYEGGCNPVNVTYVTGLGWKRQRDIVHQWASVDRQALPPSGIPVGNIQANFGWLWAYGGMLSALCFPSDSAVTAPYPFYDRWGDSWNVSAEFVIMNSARSLGCLAFLAAQTTTASQPWKPVAGQITLPAGTVPIGQPVTVSLAAQGIDLGGARIVWEARDQEPAVGPNFTFTPVNNGAQWVEAEAQLPDGRRIFATGSVSANAENIVWCDDAVPAGATAGSEGGDTWNWVSTGPAPFAGNRAHQSAIAAGAHQHFFSGATATLTLEAEDTLYAYVYLDPANPPSEIMLQWNDGSWDHRAYWGANVLGYGVNGTEGRRYMGPLPAAGQWVQLKVPAKLIGLGGRTINGMAFSLFGGRATWDAAGRLSSTRAVN